MGENKPTLRMFFEDYPLYRPFVCRGVNDPLNDDFTYPPTKFYCEHCKSEETFNGSDQFQTNRKTLWNVAGNSRQNATRRNSMVTGWKADYMCAACKLFNYYFHLRPEQVDDESNDYETVRIMKVGQDPRFQIKIERVLRDSLGQDVAFYEKGIHSESYGFGIGAFSYYRRVIDGKITNLLDEIGKFIEENQKPEYQEALKNVHSSKDTKSKIDCVKHLLPTELQPNGQNPLQIIYSALSEGMHGHSEEDCLALAANLRGAMTYLLQEIPKRQHAAKVFEKSLKAITKQATSR